MTAGTVTSPLSVRAAPVRPSLADREESSRGAVYGFLAHAVWGLFPLYFHADTEAEARNRSEEQRDAGRHEPQ